jgi:hypothetical protein
MNIAFCVSGMPRNIDKSYQWLKTFVLNPISNAGHNYDFFISTWNNNVQKEGDASVKTSGDNAQDFVRVFNPKKFETEDWNDEIRTKLRWPEFEQCKFEITPRSSALGQFHKIYKCNELRKQYELENNIKYDVVFRIRTEIRYNNPLDLKELDIIKNCKEPIIFLRRGPNPQNYFWFKDTMAFGNSEGMNIYSDTINNCVDVAKNTKVSTAELILRNCIMLKNPLVEHTSLDYTLIRD